MKKFLQPCKGFSLIEVLASIVLISILFMLVSTFFINSSKQNNHLNRNLTSIQLSQALLDVWTIQDFSELESNIGNSYELDSKALKEKLQLSSNEELPFVARVSIKRHEELLDRIIVINVTVSTETNTNQTTVEGYVRK